MKKLFVTRTEEVKKEERFLSVCLALSSQKKRITKKVSVWDVF